MATILIRLNAGLVILLATTMVSAAQQDTMNMVPEESPNGMEPLNRQARQFWKPPTYNPPGTLPGYRSFGIGAFHGIGGGFNIGGFNVGAGIGHAIGGAIGFRGGSGGGDEAWACGVLCPDDDGAYIPYRSPRPTKGKFIGIHG